MPGDDTQETKPDLKENFPKIEEKGFCGEIIKCFQNKN